ncbi:MAG: bifunctional riboflavin kinase/FAD synthetase [Calditrichaeota bacterium]|nr:bifunctional riboflavin kinase/FAD synthetase [Calditrichota bacterium]MCB9366523.1 bifunctional riboflavin kinase/FAD synthetase [Calditrichota bacterium]MCB9391219.1 bifunctional riboflavin kinase/FAD synthetase [Calditrichota bacterium]
MTQASAVTVGTFDGVHIGHVSLLRTLSAAAARLDAIPLVATFDRHPRSIVGNEPRQISHLSTFEERLALIEAQGVEHVFVMEFTDSVRNLTAREFVEEFVLRRWNAKALVAGYNHSFGRDRGGDRESLIGFGRSMGFEVEIVPPVLASDQPVSSTQIRRFLLDGEIRSANEMLGRHYSVGGTVVRGYGRGKGLGCPTANLDGFAENKLIPRDGIYAAFAKIDGTDYGAAVSIGYNPTFQNARHSVEAHVIGFEGDLYGRRLELEFVQRMRGEIRFTSTQALSEQMNQDVSDVQSVLRSEGRRLVRQDVQPNTES